MSERSTKIMICDSCGSEKTVNLDLEVGLGYPDGFYLRRFSLMDQGKVHYFEDLFGCKEECAIKILTNKDLEIRL